MFLTPTMASFFFFNDTATTEIYTLSLHDALPISPPTRTPAVAPIQVSRRHQMPSTISGQNEDAAMANAHPTSSPRENRLTGRSEEHTSELQSQSNLVCRLLLEKTTQTGTHEHLEP